MRFVKSILYERMVDDFEVKVTHSLNSAGPAVRAVGPSWRGKCQPAEESAASA